MNGIERLEKQTNATVDRKRTEMKRKWTIEIDGSTDRKERIEGRRIETMETKVGRRQRKKKKTYMDRERLRNSREIE